jgi:pimeloyl-ACP methyl ester carboxylesterase
LKLIIGLSLIRYGWLASELSKFESLEVICRNFPDPYTARESVWLPFIKNDLGGSLYSVVVLIRLRLLVPIGFYHAADENTILVGHSSGAEAIMRYLEKNKIHGAVLVSACWTDLGEVRRLCAELVAFSLLPCASSIHHSAE